MPEDAPEVAQDLIKKLLLKDPSKRIGADDLNKLKAHPFFEGVKFDSLYDTMPPLLDKHMRLSLQQQKELKFLPRKQKPSNQLQINTRKPEEACFADRVRSQMSASIIHSPMSSGPVPNLAGERRQMSKSIASVNSLDTSLEIEAEATGIRQV